LVDAGRFPPIHLPLIGVGVAALWPLTAYAFSPLLLPAICVLATAIVVVIWRPEYGLATAIALLPLSGVHLDQPPTVGPLTLPADPFKVLVPLLIFVVLLYGVLVRGPDTRPLPAVFVGIILMIGAALLSIIQALEPPRAVTFLLITGAALFLAIPNICRTRQQLRVVLSGALVGLLITSIQGIVQHQRGDFATAFDPGDGAPVGRVEGAFGHPNDYAGFLALLIPVALAVAATTQFPKTLRVLAGVAGAVAIPAIVFSYARWSMAACVVGSLVWLVLLRPKLALTVAAAIGIAALLFAPDDLRARFQGVSEGEVTLRQDVNSSALDIYAEDPILGVGINNFQVAYSEYRARDTASQTRWYHNEQLLVPTFAPSQFLNTLTEQGLVGFMSLLVFMSLAVRTAWRASRARDPTVRGLGLGVGMAAATLLVNSVSSISFQDVTVWAFFALLAMAAIAEDVFLSRRPEGPSNAPP
jgi:O-antigen ligase